MVIGILQFELLVHDGESLKDKRRVVKSVKDKLHREHLVSIAEIGALDMLNVAVMGLALVGNDGGHVGEVLDRISAKLRCLPDAELGDCTRQILHGSEIDALTESSGAGPDPAGDPSLAAELLRHFEADQDRENPPR